MPELPAARLAEIRALKPNSPPRDLWCALQDLVADNQQLTNANVEAAEELAQWTGQLR